MNARIAVLENQILINFLADSAKKFAERKKISPEQALELVVQIRINRAKREGEKALWEQRRDAALKIIKG